MNKYGLVFSGGGSKGSYEIGVWKALNELGITDKITGISGSSIGAFNTALFLQHDQHQAEQVWLNATNGDFINLNIPKILEKIFADYTGPKDALLTNIDLIGTGRNALDMVSNKFESLMRGELPKNDGLKNYAIWAAQNLFGDGFATPDRLIQIIKNNVDFTKMDHLGFDLFSTVCRWDTETEIVGQPEYISWNTLSDEQILNLIATSMALPVLYPHAGGEAEHYVDGGYADNTPIQPLYDAGYREIIVVYLEPYFGKDRKKRIAMEESLFPDATLYRIFPNENFDFSFGKSCSITQKKTETNLRMGYDDTMQYFSEEIYEEEKSKKELRIEAKAKKQEAKAQKKLEKLQLKEDRKAEKAKRR